MTQGSSLHGRYVVGGDGRIVPDDAAVQLLRKQQSMLLLGASGRAPDFFYDPVDGTYWESLEYEDGQLTLRQVDRTYIEENWPNVDPDARRTVDWPVRY